MSVDDVARAAGISRGLLFHYFASKQDFQVAVAERAAKELLEATATDPSAPPLEQLRAGVEAFVDHVEPRGHAYRSLVRGATAGEPALRAVGERTRRVLARRVLDGLEVEPAAGGPSVVELVVRGWVAASEEIIVTWLEASSLPRSDLVDLLVEALVRQLVPLLDPDQAARLLSAGT